VTRGDLLRLADPLAERDERPRPPHVDEDEKPLVFEWPGRDRWPRP
jgi:hypothetical protein